MQKEQLLEQPMSVPKTENTPAINNKKLQIEDDENDDSD